MKPDLKHLFLFITALVILTVSLLIVTKSQRKGADSIVKYNIEALSAHETTSNGIEYECLDDFCMIFEYKNRSILFGGGCKAAPGFICSISKTEWPSINF